MNEKPEKKPLTPNQVKILFPMFETALVEVPSIASWPPVNFATYVILRMRHHPILKHVHIELWEVETAVIAWLNFRQ